MALGWMFLLLLTPLLAAQRQELPDLNTSGEPQETGGCKAPSNWDLRLQFTPNRSSYALNDLVELSCPGDYVPSVTQIRCISSGTQTLWNTNATCKERCQHPLWDSELRFTPEQKFYGFNEEVTLSCFKRDAPPFAVIRCKNETLPHLKETWEVNIQGTWHGVTENLTCSIGSCQKPKVKVQKSIQFNPNQKIYGLNEELRMNCSKEQHPPGIHHVPSFHKVKCAKRVVNVRHGKPVYRNSWWAWNSTSAWILFEEAVKCIEMCQRPQWKSRLRLTPDQENYKKDEEVMLSCPEGFQPPFTKVKCLISNGKPSYTDPWLGKDSRGDWINVESSLECIEVLQVVPESLHISSTSIKLNWTCRLSEACQNIQASCQPEKDYSSPWEAEEVEGEEILQGQEGTFTCSSLQPFTVYSVNIFLPPSTILYTRLLRTKETVPDKPEELWLDPSTGSLRWKALSSCNGDIIGYQLNITAWSTRDGGYLEVERLRLSGSVTEHPLPEHWPRSSFVVTLRGLTAAGAGAASRWEFAPSSSDTAQPLDISCTSVRDVSPSRGTAVLPLRPIAVLPEEDRQHQLIVVAAHNGTVLEGVCSGQPQPFNASQPPDTYVAAVLNLSAPMDFVLGDGAHGQGYRNAALQPGRHYTALLRRARRSQQAEKFTCVCYSVSVGQEPVPPLDRIPMVTAVALIIVLLALGILLLFVLFRQRYNSSESSDNNSAIPLRRPRGGVSKLNTQIPVEELLEALKRFKRAELEAELTEDEAVDKHDVGRLREYQQLSSTLLHPCDAGKELCNQSKNRYKSIIPYDHCRVVLQPSDVGNGYINASYVDSYRSPRLFIAAQGPLPGTVVDFWQMVWQEKTSVIVMLTGLVEQNKTKCEQYWPEEEQVYGDFTVTLNNTRTTTGLVTRIFCLQKAGCALPRVVEQFHYLLWPDHGVPRNPAQLLCLVEMVNKRILEVPSGPVLVHCSAGIGRTGTFIALDFLLKMAKAEGKVDVFQCVQRLREQRVSMVQTKEQYTFLYEVLLEGLLCSSTRVPVESFASHMRCLREAETSRHNILEKEFKAVQKFSELFQLLPCREAEKPSNQPKNRKPGILPADSCRPILMSSLNADGSPGYINAVFANTHVEFWPTKGAAAYGRFHVHLISEEPGTAFTAWTLALTNRQQPKKSALEVCFWQLRDWPMQQRLPPHPATIISLLGKVETHHRQSQDGHILVTCCDGASRSGVFCAASFLCEQIQSEGLVDVSQAVRMLKRRRRQLIKDVEQYGLCYELALSYLNSFETYGNFK
ncbi:receptor-type tyrosine-protein phosphatase kappa isoform X2 [Colius striatus]|uniref:receptor-type tyrosine-protein phosphatase kappa isoform X2 n=1 Tax=Colius striatus TaxID=57412 RepID=UPI002B1D9ABD|nr:receptor-type tyrosine-protein phosphatase kappa isoform X2 [Colius striatus]